MHERRRERAILMYVRGVCMCVGNGFFTLLQQQLALLVYRLGDDSPQHIHRHRHDSGPTVPA